MRIRQILFVSISLFIMSFPSLTYGGKPAPFTEEIKKLQLENNKLKNEIVKIKGERNKTNTEYRIALSDITNYKRIADIQFTIVRHSIAIIALFMVLLMGIGVYVIHTLFGKRFAKLEKDMQIATKRACEATAKVYAKHSLENWNEYKKEQRTNLLSKALFEAEQAKKSIEMGYGKDLSQLDDTEKYNIIMVWQNLAYFIAEATDHDLPEVTRDQDLTAWAIEKAKIALKWANAKDFKPPEVKPLFNWIDSYFYILMKYKYDDAANRQEWAKNYDYWRDKLDISFEKEKSDYDSYLQEIKQLPS